MFREKKRHGSIDLETPTQSPPNATNRTELVFQKLVKLDVYIFVAISYRSYLQGNGGLIGV